MTLAEVLLARITHREAVARRTATIRGRDWVARPVMTSALRAGSGERMQKIVGTEVHGDSSATWHPFYFKSCQAADGVVAEFLALNDPATVLAACEAKRRIVALHTPARTARAVTEGKDYMSCPVCDPFPPEDDPNPGPCETLRLLALPYTDHPDYRGATWRL